VSLLPRVTPAVPSERAEVFTAVVRAAFAHRRKIVENSLADAGLVADRQQAIDALIAAGLSPGRRAEMLSIEEFVRLAAKLSWVA
jgi:16S rRNA (adenine1518-N6/adenine1519-N6)-dimethyltransferase